MMQLFPILSRRHLLLPRRDYDLNDGDGEEGEGSDVTAISATDCKECLQCTRDAYTSLTSSDTPRTRITTL